MRLNSVMKFWECSNRDITYGNRLVSNKMDDLVLVGIYLKVQKCFRRNIYRPFMHSVPGGCVDVCVDVRVYTSIGFKSGYISLLQRVGSLLMSGLDYASIDV